MSWFWLVIVALPLLKLAMLTNLKRRQLAARSLHLLKKFGIFIKDAACIERPCKEFAHDLDVHRGSHRKRMVGSIGQTIAIFWRNGWTSDQMSRTVVNQIVEKKPRSIAQNWPGTLAQELLVERKSVMIPCVEREPRSAHRPDAPAITVDRFRITPEISIVVDHKTTSAVVSLRHLRS